MAVFSKENPPASGSEADNLGSEKGSVGVSLDVALVANNFRLHPWSLVIYELFKGRGGMEDGIWLMLWPVGVGVRDLG